MRTRPFRARRLSLRALWTATLLVGACAAYRPLPLPKTSELAPDAAAVRIEADVLRGTGLDRYPFDPSDGLDPTEAAMLAVSNNPDLKAARAKAGVARSQLLAAGFLPDPVLSLSVDVPVTGAGAVPGLGIGLREALDALLTRSDRVAAAEAQVRSVDLGLLWQEWQVAQQARLLCAKIDHQERKVALLQQRHALYVVQGELDRRGLEQGDVTLDETSARTAALIEIEGALGELTRQVQADQGELRTLLGISPQARLTLQQAPGLPPPRDEEVQAALRDLPSRRPDLLALQAGYESQEARLRVAVLEQFPGVEAEIRGGWGTDRVGTVGLSVGLRLPFFNRNRGAIAEEEATRGQLRLEYRARLARAEAEVHRLWADLPLAETDLRRLEEALPALQAAARRADGAYEAEDLTGPGRLGTVDAYLRSASEVGDRKQSLQEARLALQTLLGLPRTVDVRIRADKAAEAVRVP